jgi:predicted TIM-barrel fold metal-dependent hydrolase
MSQRRPWFLKVPTRELEADIEPPLCLGSYSNGEYFHLETDRERRLKQEILRQADRNARRVGMDRRSFLASAMGMATSLAVIDSLSGCSSDSGRNTFTVASDGGVDGQAACAALDTSGEFIFDVQTHHVNPLGPWRETNHRFKLFVTSSPQASCAVDGLSCFSAQHYVEQIFINSDTKVAVLSIVPYAPCDANRKSECGPPIDNDEVVATRELVNRLAQSQRSLNHCLVEPNINLAQQLAVMEETHRRSRVAAWKLYPGFGADGIGYFVDDPQVGIPVIEKARELGVKIICAHKGLPLQGFDPVHNHPRDMAAAAKMFPDVSFIVYHSAYNYGAIGPMDNVPETPFDPMEANPKGTSSLIKSMMDSGLAPGPSLNLYAELGGAWSHVMTSPDQAAHLIGKLVKYFGPDNVLWGTDCIWTGSPQAQIEAFWAFQIGADFQEKYGYPALTDDIKRKILGLNAARVYGVDVKANRCSISRGELAQAKQLLDAEIGQRRWVMSGPTGPRTWSEYQRLHSFNGNRPG